MNMRKVTRILIIVLCMGFTFSTAYTLYAMVGTDYDSKYKDMLAELDVHDKFKREIDKLVGKGYDLSDLMVAYEFLYQSYGRMQELEALVKQQDSGKSWEHVFKDYNKSHKPFVPRAFDTDYLESLMKTNGLTSDDIMIADRIGFVSAKAFKDILIAKLETQNSWKEIAAEHNIVNSSSTLPRVPVTQEELSKFTSASKLTEERVTEAIVLAKKIGKTPQQVISSMKSGQSEEAILADGYVEKYR
ncbi:hypothetical protein MH117_13480 [Paenibacillus sp. ACRRX]|uniref:hypothetical protein n=1 Tax=Paenibacillus sp. ACRRX TaxID=2918206 RepID=UPI001EF69117|nr:hypothetical protein [Paenibacillus sp. ACRRX]MCG7408436.1 hypothetical protein [Paenibacillus sp. ACRRX]